jgi:type II restriction/modification system DNA methylase subunit YeeA
METAKLKKFAQFARRSLIAQVTARIELVLEPNSAARRERTAAVAELEKAINAEGKDQVVERVAYTWFNRFCALRFMDVNRYNRVRIVSPADPSQFQPEILAEAKMGHLDDEMVNERIRAQVNALLAGQTPSRDPQGEAYRLLLVAACNFWNKDMPFLFQRINDYTELLMPDDLLSGNSILTYTREAMTPDACEDVEVIGWLYQFYISEKKEEVFEGLKKNIKITPENIPAATQLFTPHWIVRYLVENSLGRLWLLNRPNSRLIEQMDYYIAPVESGECEEGSKNDSTHSSPLPATHLRISSPEEIRICDPACGSGHMLTYAFDLLYAIYEEEGYEPAEIPEKILTHNLFGIEIDERAGELAAFALTMKARARQRLFFKKNVRPNICVLENIHFDERELQDYIDFIGRDLFILPLQTTLRQFEEAKNFGSLIRPELTDVDSTLKTLESKNVSGQLFLSETHQKVLKALRQAEFLSPKYHVVIANPPYMGGKGMNPILGNWVKDQYPDSKSDLFAVFIERNLDLALKGATVSMITMQSWMFLSSYEKLRASLITGKTLLSMAHLGARAFDSIGGEVVSTVAFVIKNAYQPEYKGNFLKLTDGQNETEKENALLKAVKNYNCGWFYRASASDFKKIPGSPIAYWLCTSILNLFQECEPLSSNVDGRVGLMTSDNSRFLRFFWELSDKSICFNSKSDDQSIKSNKTWFPHNKGGSFRKWVGNYEYVVNWFNSGQIIKETVIKKYPYLKGNPNFVVHDDGSYFKPFITWSEITSSNLSFRLFPSGFTSNIKGMRAFPLNDVSFQQLLALLNSKFTNFVTKSINPTLSFGINNLYSIPSAFIDDRLAKKIVNPLIAIAKFDWDSYETSWNFTNLPILNLAHANSTLTAIYQKLRTHWREMTLEMQRLEEENNRIFIDAYGLQDELTPEVPLEEITLTCNPHYRYGSAKSEDELEALLLADTMREFISYAVGCMFGRYSLDMPGLVLANQGEGVSDYRQKIEEYWKNERQKLSRVDSLAEVDGFGGADLPVKSVFSEGGTLWANQSDSESGGIDPIKHSGGAVETVDGGIQEFSVDSARVQSRSGNADYDRQPTGLPVATSDRASSESDRGDQTNDLFPHSQTDITPHSPLPTLNLPLPTSHSPLPTSHFLPDDDNVIPILDGSWFADDITERFKQFLKLTFGSENYQENLRFIEQALNVKGRRDYSIRDYFLNEFYSDHVRRYKKRPIYWLFTSPKGSFNALIYMHRYRPDTVSVVLNKYLREFRSKLTAHKAHLASISISEKVGAAEKTKALKEIERVVKMIAEIEEYEREVLYPLATQRLEIDLDDGVKVNYLKFGGALKKIVGLESKEE